MGTRPPSTGREADRVDLGTYGSMWIFYLRYKIFNDLRIRSERTPEKHGAFPALRPNRRADGDFGPRSNFRRERKYEFSGELSTPCGRNRSNCGTDHSLCHRDNMLRYALVMVAGMGILITEPSICGRNHGDLVLRE